MLKPSHYRNQNSGDGSWYGFFGDIYSGVAVGIGHSKWFFLDAIDKVRKRIASLSGFENDTSINNENNINIAEGLKVVGVGYGRTGTYSLALALDELGFRTLHTQHLYENHELFDHFVEEIFHKSIRSDDVIMGRPDFDLVLKSGYVATMDLPFALYFDQIHERYPNCKFILTVRENSEVWFKSWNVLTQSISKPARYTRFLASHAKKLGYYMRWLFSVVNNDKRFLSHPFPLPPQSKPDSIASYERHNQLVRDTLPRSHLLEYNVRQGWEPLCQFLDISAADCPTDVPFPKSNSALAVQWQSYSSFLIFWVLFIALCLMIKIVFFRVMGITVIGWFRVQRQKRREQRSKKSR